MNIKKLSGVSEQDMSGKGNVGRSNPPGVSAEEMQRILDELPREVLAPAVTLIAESQNENNSVFAAKLDEITSELEKKMEKGNTLELDNLEAYTPTKDYHPATALFVRQQIESHAASDQLHISEEERRLGRLAEKITFSAPAGSFTPAPGVDFALTADADVPVTLKAPSAAGNQFLTMRGFIAISSEGSAEWGNGVMFPDGVKPVLEPGNSYLLEYFYHPKLPESSNGKWSVRCTRFH